MTRPGLAWRARRLDVLSERRNTIACVSLRGVRQIVTQMSAFSALSAEIARGHLPAALGLLRNARPVVAAALAEALQLPMLYVASSVESSRMVSDALSRMCALPAVRLPEPNTAFYDVVAPSPDVIAQYAATLAAFVRDTPMVVVASPRALMQPLTHPDRAREQLQTVRVGDVMYPERAINRWMQAGYAPEPVVERIGAMSRRGGILDVWSPAHTLPVRIELFGNVIETLREFDPSTQRSTRPLEEALIAPLSVFARSQAEASLVDYLPSRALVLLDDEAELQDAWRTLEERAQRERESAPAGVNAAHITWEQFESQLAQRQRSLTLGQSARGTLQMHPLAACFAPAPHFNGQLTPLLDYLRAASAEPDARVWVISRQAARLAEIWSERHAALAAQSDLDEVADAGLSFVAGAMMGGFVLREVRQHVTLLTDAEIYGHVRVEWFQRGRARRAAPEKAFADWRVGDAVVHEDYGIGIYRGLAQLTVKDADGSSVEREYLLLEYADGDRLYVPLHQLDRVQRYVGSSDAQPRLDKLGSDSWEKARRKAQRAAMETARELLTIYAARELASRPPYGPDTPWQAEMEAAFPFIETDDQLRVIQEVKEDMQRPQPMDRLVVGDVGFGKTEVALRAAFKAVMSGRQVAVLAPTTVLTQQHWNTFSQRLASYPIRVEMLSRFCTPAEKARTLQQLTTGEVDIVIGTHALLSDKVQFHNLGLLIVDEEHRFGVKDKEKLKRLRTQVDVLTLSATPIPRTLYMGLSGLRAVSRIETPPLERLPVITFVGAWDDALVQQAIRRELDRDGQIFFVHNRIQTIEMMAQKIQRLVPEVKLAIAHGQMPERALAQVMRRFADGEISLLLCTNIIESGLDISNANTIIVTDADHFGLAELHQLRGRVGRSSVQAYAYLFYSSAHRITPEARERLETLRENSSFGAGYSIALRDLELRGAGELLGAKQSGHISAVGFDLYARLLAQETARLRALREGKPPPAAAPSAVTIDLPITVGLPPSYVSDAGLRVQLYRRAASLETPEQLQQFEDELRDRFGPLPQAARNLVFQLRLKLLAMRANVVAILSDDSYITVRTPLIRQLNATLLRLRLGDDVLIGREQIRFPRAKTADAWKARLVRTLEHLAEMAALRTASAEPPSTLAAKPHPPREAKPESAQDALPSLLRDADW